MGLLDRFRPPPIRDTTLSKGTLSTPDPLAIKATPEDKRVVPELLEKIYSTDALVYTALNKTMQVIMAADYTLEGDSDSVQFFEKFLEKIGFRGGEDDWYSILKRIFLYQMIYGYCPLELIYNEDGNMIVDLDIIDPKKFSYAKAGGWQLALDKYGNPIGYVERLPPLVYGMLRTEVNKIPPPPGVTLFANEIFLPAERVANIKMHVVGDGFFGEGLIEPIYEICMQERAARDGFANASHRAGHPMLWAQVGDDLHPATEEKLKNTVDELKEVNSKTAFATEHFTKLQILESKAPEKMRSFLDYYTDMKLVGLGLPKAFVMGSGEATNRATLARQEYMAKLTMKDMIRSTCYAIESKIFKRIADMHNTAYPNGNKIKIVRFKWGEVAFEELESRATRIQKYLQSGGLRYTPELENYIQRSEGLPEVKSDEPAKPIAPAGNPGVAQDTGSGRRSEAPPKR